MARIVHIEDDPANRLLVRKLLARAGHDVLDAEDGLEGVRLAVSSRPDLVLVDLNIPGLDGYEVALRLRGEKSLEGVPIVAITAEGDRDTSLSVGCDGFLQKPIDARTFAETLARYLRGEREEPPPHRNQRLREQSQRIVSHLEEKVSELSRVNARLRDVDAARTAFYRNVTHELATPMTPIVGYVKLLHDEELGPLEPQQKRALGSVQDCVTRLRQIIDNLLDVTALETGRMRFSHTSYDVRASLVRALDRYRGALAIAGLELVTDIPERDAPAVGDAERFQRAVAQLLDNATKFVASGGRVGVRLDATDGGYRVTVADTGAGIPEERQARIFDAFYQVDSSVTREHGGTGVGLAIARRIARGLGGELTVASPCDVSLGGGAFRGVSFALSVASVAPVQLDAERLST
ncbi:MAG: hybrid sensor histidine kinase/response regulator [Deltaproteobacteria bacterium]|nr:hybrid sensor histidine kinase/response regulator [Deltaproteobacteria bacterium]